MTKEVILFQNGFKLFKRFLYIDKHCCNNAKSIVYRQYSQPASADSPDPNERIIKLSLIGAPNTGKSTLINSLIGRKVCAASNKVHTTTKVSRAICVEGNTQIVILDTPGTVTHKEQKKYNINEKMSVSPKNTVVHGDIMGVVHDVSNKWLRHKLNSQIRDILSTHSHIPSFLVLNKIDLLKSKRCLFDLVYYLCNGILAGTPIIRKTPGKGKPINEWDGYNNFSDVFMISALENDGVDEIKQYLLKNAKPGKWMFSGNSWTDRTPETIVIDTVRAKFLDFLDQELPYELVIEMEYFEDKPDRVVAHVTVTCKTERKMRLIAGAGDGRLMQITDFARDNLVHAFQKHVSLNISLRTNNKIEK